MNKRQKKKQFKKKLEQLRQQGIDVSGGAVSQHLAIAFEPFRRRMADFEERYNKRVDKEVQRRAKELIDSEYLERIRRLEEFPVQNYLGALREAGYQLEDDDILVIPNLNHARDVARIFMATYYNYLESQAQGRNKGIYKMMAEMEADSQIERELTDYFIKYQTDEIRLRSLFQEHIKMFVNRLIEQYQKERAQYVFSRPNYMG